MKKSRIILIILVLLVTILPASGLYFILLQQRETKIYQEATTICNNLYDSNHLPKEELTTKELSVCQEKI